MRKRNEGGGKEDVFVEEIETLKERSLPPPDRHQHQTCDSNHTRDKPLGQPWQPRPVDPCKVDRNDDEKKSSIDSQNERVTRFLACGSQSYKENQADKCRQV